MVGWKGRRRVARFNASLYHLPGPHAVHGPPEPAAASNAGTLSDAFAGPAPDACAPTTGVTPSHHAAPWSSRCSLAFRRQSCFPNPLTIRVIRPSPQPSCPGILANACYRWNGRSLLWSSMRPNPTKSDRSDTREKIVGRSRPAGWCANLYQLSSDCPATRGHGPDHAGRPGTRTTGDRCHV
jgi:hypothetical protein